MKALFISLCLSLLMIMSSCEGQTGYLDEGQQNTVAMLTDVEWLVVYADYGLGNEQTFDDETNIYSFGRDTKGWTAVGSLKDPSVKKDVQYFQWTFTTENYTVIYTSGNATEGYYWLIEKLTPTDFWVQWSVKDPVLYPNQTTSFYKLRARKRQ
ncbi:hypothetical protein [Xylanibacter rodentium]|uniref:hypothetical protein n=1 Tax=Xylanibacter rodentium TaxID=2736289 RepID=UPI0011DD9D61|nr:hypothetical protein [Xylanibacter rodentium]